MESWRHAVESWHHAVESKAGIMLWKAGTSGRLVVNVGAGAWSMATVPVLQNSVWTRATQWVTATQQMSTQQSVDGRLSILKGPSGWCPLWPLDTLELMPEQK